MNRFLGTILALLFPTLFATSGACAESSDGRFNVLCIISDDLRPELGCYDADYIHCPNIDALAARGLVFRRAYCQQALCFPSRNSFFSGLRVDDSYPQRAADGELLTFRCRAPDIVALPQLFKQHGYFTRGLGKILHHSNGQGGPQNDPISWSAPFFYPHIGQYAAPENKDKRITVDRAANFENPLFEGPDVPDNAYFDGRITDEAIATINKHVEDRAAQPFFLMVGLFKPHTPFNAPKRYWDRYDRKSLALADNPFPPENVPAKYAMNAWRYVRSFRNIPDQGPVPEELARDIRHAYYACISYVDAQVGRLLRALDRHRLRDDTVVLLWSDHGYQLGEHGMWCKHTNFETSTRVPLVVSVPGKRTAGQSTDGLVELVDIYPTLVDICRLPKPDHLQGTSFAPLLDDPSLPWKTAAFSQYSRAGALGRSARTERWRYNEWQTDGIIVARELYDHETDPYENRNLAGLAEHATTIERLSVQLKAGWKAARPPEARN